MTKTYLNTTPQSTTVACLSCGAQCDPSGFSVPVTSLKEETSLKLNLGLLAKHLWTIQESRGSEPHGNSKYTSETVRSKGVGSNKTAGGAQVHGAPPSREDEEYESGKG